MKKQIFLIVSILIAGNCAAMHDNEKLSKSLQQKEYNEEIVQLKPHETLEGLGEFKKEYKLHIQVSVSEENFSKTKELKVLNAITGLFINTFDSDESDNDSEADAEMLDNCSEKISYNTDKTLIVLASPGEQKIYILKNRKFFPKNITENCSIDLIDNPKKELRIQGLTTNKQKLNLSVPYANKETHTVVEAKLSHISCLVAEAQLFIYEKIFPKSVTQLFKSHVLTYDYFKTVVSDDSTLIFLDNFEVKDDFQRNGLGTKIFLDMIIKLQKKYAGATVVWLADPSNGTVDDLCNFYSKKCGGTMVFKGEKNAYFYLKLNKQS